MLEMEQQLYRLLKNKVSERLQENYNVTSQRIEDWKGKDIEKLQKDLGERINGRISEKWFYTHLKAENERLPRIDMLDLLSEYVGYENWLDFKVKNKKQKKKVSNGIIITICAIMGVAIWTSMNLFGGAGDHKYKYQFCFADRDNNRLLGGELVEVLMLNQGESPSVITCDSLNCFAYESDSGFIEFVVKLPYYNTDTIRRNITTHKKREVIKLKTDDYALMLHLFSTSQESDWDKRRKQLDEILNDDARIFEVLGEDEIGVEMYNKKEFIDKMTMPLTSLNNIKILETAYKNNLISMIRFKQE